MNEPLRLHLLAEALDLTIQGALHYTTLYYTVLCCSLELDCRAVKSPYFRTFYEGTETGRGPVLSVVLCSSAVNNLACFCAFVEGAV